MTTAVPLWAQPLPFKVDDSIIVVRGRDAGQAAQYEFIAEGNDRAQCVPLDGDGKPLAVDSSYASIGAVSFEGMAIAQIAKVVCRRTG